MTAADVVADGLRRAGVGRAFYAHDADATIVDAVREAGVTIVAAPRPASACVMAAVTGRLREAPGLALIATDDAEVTGALAASARDYAPTIVLASRAPDHATTKTTVVAGADSAAHWVAHAAQAAMSEPPGCVWLVVPRDVAPRPAIPMATAARPAAIALEPVEVEAIVAAVAAAARPLLVAGHGCRPPGTAAWLRAFAEALPAPVLVTPAARGTVPDPHPLCHGLLRRDAEVVRRADLVLALGVDDGELADVRFAAPMVRVGRVGPLLEEMAPRLRDRARADWDVAELDRLRRASPFPVVAPSLAALVTRLREATPVGAGAVFARSLEPAPELWHSVQPADVLVEDDVLAASAAVALERPENVVLALSPSQLEGATTIERAGVHVIGPDPATIESALARALAGSGPRIVVVPLL